MEQINGKIYKLEFDDGYFYIGRTEQILDARLSQHKSDAKLKGTKLYNYARTSKKFEIHLIKDGICSKKDLWKEEGLYIDKYRNDEKCLNTQSGHIYTSPEDHAENSRIWKIESEIKREREEEYYKQCLRNGTYKNEEIPPLFGGVAKNDGHLKFIEKQIRYQIVYRIQGLLESIDIRILKILANEIDVQYKVDDTIYNIAKNVSNKYITGIPNTMKHSACLFGILHRRVNSISSYINLPHPNYRRIDNVIKNVSNKKLLEKLQNKKRLLTKQL